MAESSTHTDLVRCLTSWAVSNTTACGFRIVYADLPDTLAADRPPAIYGYYPDMYCANKSGEPIYIGEAKTARDLETKRSIDQITAFLRFIADHEGSTLVVAVPWQAVPSARSVIRAIRRVTSMRPVDVQFLDMLSG